MADPLSPFRPLTVCRSLLNKCTHTHARSEIKQDESDTAGTKRRIEREEEREGGGRRERKGDKRVRGGERWRGIERQMCGKE